MEGPMRAAGTVFDAKQLQRAAPLLALFVFCVVLAHPSAWAGFVTTNEAELDAIFQQPAFGSTPIDVRFNPTVTIGRPDLLTIDTEQQLDTLFGLGGNVPIIDIFFVDEINACGEEHAPPIIGCGDFQG